MRTDVVAVIPAFGCGRTVGSVVTGVRRLLGRVVVVDDGSPDDTAAAATAAGAEVITLAHNSGKGAALQIGISRALAMTPAALVLLDADGQHDPDDLPALLAAWDDGAADLIIGTRLADAAAIPPLRYWTNYIGSRALSWVVHEELDDSQSGYRLLSAPLAARLELQSPGYEVETEMLIKAVRYRARLAHVPVRTIYNGGTSHFRALSDTYRIFRAAIYFRLFDED